MMRADLELTGMESSRFLVERSKSSFRLFSKSSGIVGICSSQAWIANQPFPSKNRLSRFKAASSAISAPVEYAVSRSILPADLHIVMGEVFAGRGEAFVNRCEILFCDSSKFSTAPDLRPLSPIRWARAFEAGGFLRLKQERPCRS